MIPVVVELEEILEKLHYDVNLALLVKVVNINTNFIV
jgi:hypothetical protein